MENRVLRKLFLGFIQVHILHHAKKEPFYGLWMIEELESHGYQLSAGTLYPILQTLEKEGLLQQESSVVSGKVRKYYRITSRGEDVLQKARAKCRELLREVDE